MKRVSSNPSVTPWLLTAAMAVLAVAPVRAEVIISDNFDGDGTDLNGSTPDVSPVGAAWIAAPLFNRNGSVDTPPTAGSATLAFTPVNGRIYTLEASLLAVGGGTANWIALGFCNGQGTGATGSDRFITGNIIGTAWMLFRGTASVSPNQVFSGTGSGTNGGTAGGAKTWAGPLVNADPGGDVDLRIVLNTTGGPGTWTATWYAKRPTEASYTEVYPTTLMSSESMSAVGLALSNSTVNGTIKSFRLSTPDAAPPPVLKIASSGGKLDFEWNSRTGRQYDLVSATDLVTPLATWPVYNDGTTTYSNIPATGTLNTLTGVVRQGPRRFFALMDKEGPPLMAEDFEGGSTPAGWAAVVTSGTGTSWQVGNPAGGAPTGPAAAAGGTNCAGTNISANYTASVDVALRSKAFTVPATGATLTYQQWIDTDLAGDLGSIRLLNAADNTPLPGGEVAVNLGATAVSVSWANTSIPLPEASHGLSVKLEFNFVSNATDHYAGFYIDDVVVKAR